MGNATWQPWETSKCSIHNTSLIKDWNFEGVLPIKIYTCKKVLIECQDHLEVFYAKDVKFEE